MVQWDVVCTHWTLGWLLLAGGVLGENALWGAGSTGGSGMWSNMNASGQYLDNPNESHSGVSIHGPHSAIPSNSAQSFDIPEFVPGVPWTGASSSNKVEDDPNITPGSVARSLSVNTVPGINGSGEPFSMQCSYPVPVCLRCCVWHCQSFQ